LEDSCPKYLSTPVLEKCILGTLRRDHQFVIMNTVSSLAVNNFAVFVKGHIISSSYMEKKG